jgi:hypothetical protein
VVVEFNDRLGPVKAAEAFSDRQDLVKVAEAFSDRQDPVKAAEESDPIAPDDLARVAAEPIGFRIVPTAMTDDFRIARMAMTADSRTVGPVIGSPIGPVKVALVSAGLVMTGAIGRTIIGPIAFPIGIAGTTGVRITLRRSITIGITVGATTTTGSTMIGATTTACSGRTTTTSIVGARPRGPL